MTWALRGRAALLAGLLVCGMIGCTIDSDATVDFINQTDETVWIAHNPHGPQEFRVPDGRWIEAEPGVRAVLSDGGCVETGELVVATGPAESAVIDARPLVATDSEICPGDDWRWSGVGDHD